MAKKEIFICDKCGFEDSMENKTERQVCEFTITIPYIDECEEYCKTYYKLDLCTDCFKKLSEDLFKVMDKHKIPTYINYDNKLSCSDK